MLVPRRVLGGVMAAALPLLGIASAAQAKAATSRPDPSVHAFSPHRAASGTTNPYSPAYRHGYRHGIIPTIARLRLMRRWALQHPLARSATSAIDLNYGGGIDGIGVTTGHEKVYLVFWGSQWGTQGTDSNGDITLSGDPYGLAPYLQEFMKGLGTGGELWSGVMTQYCDGVATGSQSCPASNTEHVAYPTGGALAGVWVDETSASPSQSDGNQIGTEAVNAAAHFGNTTAASNRDAQYVIVSPTGTNPDNYQGQGFCAWHDYNGDSALSGGPVTSPYGDIAFTNMPYLPDVGSSCGMNFVNSGSAGTLDGVSIVEGHEYAETVTDQNPPGGWTDSSGFETGDKCAWISPGTTGGAFDLSLTTGSFAVQTTWANDANSGSGSGGCEGSHQIVTNPGDTVAVTNPGSQTGTVGKPVSLQIHASSSQGLAITSYSATGLPKGLSINSATGLINGNPGSAGTSSVTLTATDSGGVSGHASFVWTVKPAGGPIKGYKARCVQDLRGGKTNGTKVVLWTCNGGSDEQWSVGSSRSLQIFGKCLTVSGGGGAGSVVVLEPCKGQTSQQWTHLTDGEWVVAHNRLCLTDPHASTTNGIQLIVDVCRATVTQRWSVP